MQVWWCFREWCSEIGVFILLSVDGSQICRYYPEKRNMFVLCPQEEERPAGFKQQPEWSGIDVVPKETQAYRTAQEEIEVSVTVEPIQSDPVSRGIPC